MFEALSHFLAHRPAALLLRDLVDVSLVAFVFYRVLLVIRGTRAMQMVVGLALIGVLNAAAKVAGLVAVADLLSTVLSSSSIVLIVVVVFQNDIRRALTRVGDRAWLTGFTRARETRAVEEVVAAATELARHRVGALIAFEQDANLDEFVVGHGISVEANVTRELLVTTFVPEGINKLHDGAVVIRNFRIASAGVFFPMPEARQIAAELGSRHRAAIGITEETDAVVVVVSEERGSIGVCYRGTLHSNLDGAALKARLFALFGHATREGEKKPDNADAARTSHPPPAPGAPPASSAAPASAPPSALPAPASSPPGALGAPASSRPGALATAAPRVLTPASGRATSLETPAALRREEGPTS